jgi:hypothetical protein
VRQRNTNLPFPVATRVRAEVARAMMVWGRIPVFCRIERVLVSRLTATQTGISGDYAARLAVEAERLPEIQVARMGGRYLIVDGHHRATAARTRGDKYIAAVVGVRALPRTTQDPTREDDDAR